MDTSVFFRSDFYRQADELSAALVRVEEAWADRFQPSWMIFIAAPSLGFMKMGQAIIDGFTAGIEEGYRDLAYWLQIAQKWQARPWFNRLPSLAQEMILTGQHAADGRLSAGAGLWREVGRQWRAVRRQRLWEGIGDEMNFTDMIGETVRGVETVVIEGEVTAVYFVTDQAIWRMYHDQEGSESVYLGDVNGDLADLVGRRIVAAEASSNDDDDDESMMWTFYKLATEGGDYVTLRWGGFDDTGYYSLAVDIERYPPEYIRARLNRQDDPDNHRKLKRLWKQYGGGKTA